MSVDLHVHTTASDGRLSPAQVRTQAMAAGLTHIAITDHDTVDGLLELEQQQLLHTSDLTIIPGIEFSTDLPQHEVHILGYFIDIHHPALQEKLALLTDDRRQRTRRILAKLAGQGYALEYDEVVAISSKSTTIGRSQIARALVAKGYFKSVGEVFEGVLKTGGPAYVPHYKLLPSEVVALIKEAGGVAVLAHPGLVGSDRVVTEVIAAGIAGIEAHHPRHTIAEVQKYRQMAEQHGLLITGGSDFHSIPGRFPEELGVFTVPAEVVQAIHARLA